jgi:hypothetical protein
LCVTAAFAADEVVFRGVPSVRVSSAPDGDSRQTLDEGAGKKNECVIVRRGKKYLWASRDNAELNRVDSGQFTYFIHARGAGYIKVFNGSREASKAPADYVEHVSVEFNAITYWGRAVALQ